MNDPRSLEIKCSCGNVDYPHRYATKSVRMLEKQICFECAFWEEIAEQDARDGGGIVINGHHYRMGEENVPKAFKGFGGEVHHIAFGNGKTVTTTNLWHQGEIPERFKNQFPNNASFAKEGIQCPTN